MVVMVSKQDVKVTIGARVPLMIILFELAGLPVTQLKFEVITQRLQIKGFIVIDHIKDGKAAKIVGELAQAAKDGKINASSENEHIVETKFEDIPKTWTLLFEGANRGKLVTKIV